MPTTQQKPAPDALSATVYTVSPEAWVSEVASLMVSRDMGDVLVVRDGKPIGIVTDRDLVVRVMAAGSDPRGVQVRRVMSEPLVTITETEEVDKAIALMTRHGIRRLPIVDGAGRLVSILTFDDLLQQGLATVPELTAILREQFHPGGKDKPQPPATPPSPPVKPWPVAPAPLVKPWPAASEPGRGHLSRPVAAMHRQTVIKAAPRVRRSRLDFLRAWFFWNRDWLQFTGLLILLAVLAAALMNYVEPKKLRDRLAPIPHYEPKDEERQLYMEYQRMKKEEDK